MSDFERLVDYLKQFETIAVAFSGGVDSSILLLAAVKAVGKQNVCAITIKSLFTPVQDTENAAKTASSIGSLHLIIAMNEIDDNEFLKNTPERCYLCKRALFSRLIFEAKQRGFNNVIDGTNIDDTLEYRPGLKALKELNVISPLQILGIGKKQVRLMAKDEGLEVYNAPSSPCLATRIPYYSPITSRKISQIADAEAYLRQAGYDICRLRHYGDTARIEIQKSHFPKIINDTVVINAIKSLGFTYVTLDLLGFRSGSMDEVLKDGNDGL